MGSLWRVCVWRGEDLAVSIISILRSASRPGVRGRLPSDDELKAELYGQPQDS